MGSLSLLVGALKSAGTWHCPASLVTIPPPRFTRHLPLHKGGQITITSATQKINRPHIDQSVECSHHNQHEHGGQYEILHTSYTI